MPDIVSLLREVSGWGVTNASDLTTDPFSPKTAFVIARRLSAMEMQLTRYSVTTQTGGPQPGSRLRPDACEIVTPKSGKWPPRWDPTALSARLSACECAAWRLGQAYLTTFFSKGAQQVFDSW